MSNKEELIGVESALFRIRCNSDRLDRLLRAIEMKHSIRSLEIKVFRSGVQDTVSFNFDNSDRQVSCDPATLKSILTHLGSLLREEIRGDLSRIGMDDEKIAAYLSKIGSDQVEEVSNEPN